MPTFNEISFQIKHPILYFIIIIIILYYILLR